MRDQVWKWVLGLVYIFAVATIWIAASFVVQSVVDDGVSPFLVTYICNSLFVVYIPLVEIGRYLEDRYGSIFFWRKKRHVDAVFQDSKVSEETILLRSNDAGSISNELNADVVSEQETVDHSVVEADMKGLDAKGRWTRWRVAKVSLLICPIWFMAQLTFNLSLKYTTVTVRVLIRSCFFVFQISIYNFM